LPLPLESAQCEKPQLNFLSY